MPNALPIGEISPREFCTLLRDVPSNANPDEVIAEVRNLLMRVEKYQKNEKMGTLTVHGHTFEGDAGFKRVSE